jgi:hypothetical protein
MPTRTKPGFSDVTVGPRTEFYSHGVERECFMTQPIAGCSESLLDALVAAVRTGLAPDPSLGALADNFIVTVKYLVSDPFTV